MHSYSAPLVECLCRVLADFKPGGTLKSDLGDIRITILHAFRKGKRSGETIIYIAQADLFKTAGSLAVLFFDFFHLLLYNVAHMQCTGHSQDRLPAGSSINFIMFSNTGFAGFCTEQIRWEVHRDSLHIIHSQGKCVRLYGISLIRLLRGSI